MNNQQHNQQHNQPHIQQFEVSVAGYNWNGVPVSMDLVIDAYTPADAMNKAEDTLMRVYDIDNAITESIEYRQF
jgi:hypothetical protein